MLIDGITIKTFDTIQQETEDLIRSRQGQDINLSSESPLGQIITALNLRNAELYELLAEVLNQTDPDTANGIFLKRLAALTGTIKKPGRKTRIKSADIYGKKDFLGQKAAPGEIKLKYGTHTFVNDSDFNSDTFNISIPLEKIQNRSFDLRINNKTCHFPMTENRDLRYFSIIFSDFVINESIFPVILPATLNIENEFLVLGLRSDTIPSIILVPQDEGEQELQVIESWGRVSLTSMVTDAISVPDGARLELSGKILQGMTGARNTKGCVPGEKTESDQDLRIRQKRELKKEFTSSVSGIHRTLFNIEGVRSVIVNERDGSHEYLPAHTIEIIIQGGEDKKIAEAIFKSKGAGISTWAPVPESEPDPNTHTVNFSGQNYQVKFQRPTELLIQAEVKIFVSEINESIEIRAKNLLLKGLNHYFSGLNTGDDLRVWKMERAVDIPDLQGLSIRVKTGSEQWNDRGIGVRSGQIAVLDSEKLTVNIGVYTDVL